MGNSLDMLDDCAEGQKGEGRRFYLYGEESEGESVFSLEQNGAAKVIPYFPTLKVSRQA